MVRSVVVIGTDIVDTLELIVNPGVVIEGVVIVVSTDSIDVGPAGDVTDAAGAV